VAAIRRDDSGEFGLPGLAAGGFWFSAKCRPLQALDDTGPGDVERPATLLVAPGLGFVITAGALPRAGVLWGFNAAGGACLVALEVCERVVHLLHPAGKFRGQRRLAASDKALKSGLVLLCRVKGAPPALQCGQPGGGLVIGNDRIVHLQIAQVGQGGSRRPGS
jgi:hypothetical protein